jgi:hypothetical protein
MQLKQARKNYDAHIALAEEYEHNPKLRDKFLEFALADDKNIIRLTNKRY